MIWRCTDFIAMYSCAGIFDSLELGPPHCLISVHQTWATEQSGRLIAWLTVILYPNFPPLFHWPSFGLKLSENTCKLIKCSRFWLKARICTVPLHLMELVCCGFQHGVQWAMSSPFVVVFSFFFIPCAFRVRIKLCCQYSNLISGKEWRRETHNQASFRRTC